MGSEKRIERRVGVKPVQSGHVVCAQPVGNVVLGPFVLGVGYAHAKVRLE